MLNIVKFNRQRGIGLLELMLAIAIIGVLLIMATRYFQSTKRADEVTQGMNAINAIRSAAGTYGGNNINDFNGISMSDIIKTGSIPNAMLGTNQGKQIIELPWPSADVAITGGSGNYTITISSLPNYACQGLGDKFNGVTSTKKPCSSGTLTLEFDVNQALPTS